MKFQAIFGSVPLALACLHSGAAAAADCKLKIVNTIPMTLVAGGSRAMVPVIINGTVKNFLLDTGGAATQISAAAAQELKLPPAQPVVKMLDAYGNASQSAVRVGAFALGQLQDRNTTLPIMTGTFSGESLFVGLLAADYMGHYDVELDFSGGKMNYFSPEHCEGKVIYWPATVGTSVPMQFWDRHLNVSVTLDGQVVKAMIDTGAPVTTLIAPEAKRLFGVTAEMPGAKQGEDRGGKTFEHVFQKLSFEGLEVTNPHIVIIPDQIGSKDPNNEFTTGSRVHRVDDRDTSDPVMLIGMNVLSKLHLYIAFSESKIYITPASSPPAPPRPE